MKEVTYTFIIPHKNHPQLLQRCVNSIPRREDVQIIVVDDDSSSDMVDWNSFCFDDERCIELHLTKGCKSAGAVRNEGMKYARGRWMLFADCDDYYTDGFMDILDTYKDSDYEALFYDVECVDGTSGEPSLYYHGHQDLVARYEHDKSLLEHIRYVMTPWTKMVSRSFVERYQIQFEDVILGNDIWFSYQVGFLAKKVEVIPHRLYVYTINSDSITNHRTVEKDVMQIETFVKRDAFFDFIGHPEWHYNILGLTKHYWKQSHQKMAYTMALLRNALHIYRVRNKYVDSMKEKMKLGEKN